MARYKFERDGEVVEVEVQWNGDGYEARIGDETWSFKPLAAGEVEPAVEPRREVSEPGADVDEKTESEEEQAEPTASSDRFVEAPISGKVSEVMVSVGEQVSRGQDMVSLEAMKLESAIQAPCDGVVGQIFVTDGQTVDEGAKIITLEGTENN